jgi:hypothetical protein
MPSKDDLERATRGADEELAVEASLSATDAKARESSLNTVSDNLHWIADQSGLAIERLGVDLKKTDDPPFYEMLLRGALDIALTAGAAGFGQLLATKFVGHSIKTAIEEKHVSEHVGEGAREFVKSSIEQGVGKGIAAGRAVLDGDTKQSAIDGFILSQRAAVIDLYKEDASQFNHVGRPKYKTAAAALALEEASNEEYKHAPQIHYDTARDAWVSYLAQQSFGVKQSPGEGAATDMSSQAERDAAWAKSPAATDPARRAISAVVHVGAVGAGAPVAAAKALPSPAAAPSLRDAILDSSKEGVLFVKAKLPEITGKLDRTSQTVTRQMFGEPHVKLAVLHGVNNAIRDQYAKKSLASIAIPRQIACEVEGDADFTVSVDERGEPTAFGQNVHWLRARAGVGKYMDHETEGSPRDGLRLLLDELAVDDVIGK